jgi:hypothetical protein
MGKPIQFKLADAAVSVELEKKVYKEDLYGKVTTLAESGGKFLKKCYLMPDGRLLQRSQLSTAKVDPEGTAVEEPTYFLGAETVPLEESSFEVIREMKAVSAEAVTAFSCDDVYALANVSLAPGVYETTFTYRKGYLPWQDALVVVKPEQAFLLIGTLHTPTFVGRSSTYAFFDAAEAADEETDLLDFSAF